MRIDECCSLGCDVIQRGRNISTLKGNVYIYYDGRWVIGSDGEGSSVF